MSRKKSAGRSPGPASTPGSPEIPTRFAPPGSDSPLLWWARGLLSAAVLVAGYLTYASLSGGGVAGCGAEDGCHEVLNSRWSKWLGIPVSLPAAAIYIVLITLSFAVGKPSTTGRGRMNPLLIRVGAWTVFGAAAWFFVLSALVLGKFCPYCLTVHLCGSAGAFLLLKHLQANRHPSAVAEPWIARSQWALVALGILIAGQVFYTPNTFRVTSVPGGSVPAATSSIAAATGTVAAKLPPVAPPHATVPLPESAATNLPAATNELRSVRSRVFALYGGNFQLDLYQLPILGSPTAPKVMVSQFDYTCEHCRRSHGPITAAHRLFSNQLAIICLPMPLDKRCNEWMSRTSPAHTNACQLAALALALWRADPAKFPEFDDWMMTSPQALQVPLALARARSLVGESTLGEAFGDPWVANTLQLSISLYRSNWLAGKSSAMPMLMVGTNIVTGTVPSVSELLRLLDQSLGLKVAL